MPKFCDIENGNDFPFDSDIYINEHGEVIILIEKSNDIEESPKTFITLSPIAAVSMAYALLDCSKSSKDQLEEKLNERRHDG